MSTIKFNQGTMTGTDPYTGEEEDLGIYPYEKINCIECWKKLYGKDGKPIPGGYHSGEPSVYLCFWCAISSDLHTLGYLIGDAIFAAYPEKHMGHFYRPNLVTKIDDILNRLRASIFQAILINMDHQKKKSDLKE